MKVIPFSNRCPRIRAEEPFILIGSTTLNANALKSRKYKKGIFFNKNFNPQQYALHYGGHYLNSDFQVYKMKDIPEDAFDSDDNLFIRSNDDSKQISGGTIFFKELLELKKNTEALYANGDIFSPDSEVFLSSLKEIGREFRFIVVDRQVIAGSQYRPYMTAYVPDYVWDFAKQMTKIWLPHDVCSLDICECGGLKVIECNCFNGCGFYRADYMQIVRAVSEYQIGKFKSQQVKEI